MVGQSFQRLAARLFPRTRSPKPQPRGFRSLRIESLEDRLVPSTITFEQNIGSAANFASTPGQTFNQLTLPIAAGHAVDANHSVFIELSIDPKAGALPTVTDSVGNVYTRDADVTNSNFVRTLIFSSHGVQAIPVGGFIRANFPAGGAQSMSAVEFCGVRAVTTPTPATGTGGSNLDPTTSSLAVTASATDRRLLIGAIGVEGNVDEAAPNDQFNNLGFTAGPGYFVMPGNGTPSGNSGNKNNSIHPEYRVVSTSGAYVANGVLNDNANGKWAAALSSYYTDLTEQFLITVSANPVTAGDTFTITVTAADANGVPVTGHRGTITFTSSDGQAILPSAYTWTAADDNNGTTPTQHTFTVSLRTAGFQTITVTETDCGLITGTSPPIQVLAATAHHLEFGQQPTTTPVNTAIAPPVTVEVVDQYGNVTTSTATIAIAIGANPAGGTLSGTTTVAAIQGVATFSNLAIDRRGTGYTLQAVSVSSLPSPGPITSNLFDIVSAFSNTVVISSLSPSTYGQSVFFTASVSPTVGTGTPAGSVQFLIDGNAFGGPVTLVGGTASSAATTLLSAGNHTITANYTNTDGNFSNSSGLFTQVVNKATLLVTADNKSRTYGATNPPFTYSITGFVNGQNLGNSGVSGTPNLATSATQASPVGTYPITPSLGSLAADNYAFAFVNGTLNVTKATLTVAADNKSRTYGAVNPPLTHTITGFVNGENLGTSGVSGTPNLATTATQASPVGTYPIMPSLGSLAASNYDFVFANGTLTVTKATLLVTANNASRVYGDPNPAFGSTITGFVNGENLGTSGVSGTPNLTTTATQASAVGAYAITPSLGTLAASNYDFAFANGTLTITKALLTVTANNASRIYGDPNPAFTATYSGFKNGENLGTSGVTGSPSLTTSATPTTAAGAYPIVAAQGDLASSNYDFAFANGTLTITKATLTVTADNKARAYGVANPPLTASYTGFKNGENLGTSGVTGAPVLNTIATVTSPVGAYPITAALGTLAASNYDFVFVNGTLTVGKTTLLVTANNASRTYGDPNPTFTATFSGFVNGQTLGTSDVTGSPSLTTSATPTTPAGSYAITAALGTLASNNYAFTFATGTLTITKATLTVTADNASRVFGAANPTFTASYSGFKNGETLATSGVSGSPSLTTTANTASPVGSYAIVAAQGTLAANNYDFAFVNGTLAVNKAATTTTVTSSLNPATAGKPVTFTATIAPVALSSGIPTGTVQFQVDGVNLGAPVPVSGGIATLTTSSLTVGTRTITALYSNTDGNFFNSTGTLTLLVKPAALTFRTIDDVYVGVPCCPITFEILGPESPPAPGPFTYSIDWDGNGTIDEVSPPNQSASYIVSHTFPVGTWTSRATVLDQTTSLTYNLTLEQPLTIRQAAVVNGDLRVCGTAAADTITVNAQNPANITVTINGVPVTNPGGPFAVTTGRIIVFGLASNDFISTPGNIKAEIYGGDGNDDLTGGNADDIIWGEAGIDSIKGGSGHDMLIGGLGADFVNGGDGHDLLIGGATSATITYSMLDAARTPWVASGGTNPAAYDALLAGQINDPNTSANRDTMTGGVGNDIYTGRNTGSGVDTFSGFVAGDIQRIVV